MVAKPEPADWQAANGQQLRLMDQETLAVLREAYIQVSRDLNVLEKRLGPTQTIQRAQLEQTRQRLLERQSQVFERLGDKVSARRIRATARSQRLSAEATAFLLDRVGRGKDGDALMKAALSVSDRAIEAAMTRLGISAVPLAQHLYRTDVWMNGRLNRLINATLASGLNAKEFARRARDWFNPNTPGGVRYAAMRLARTEINNAFHASAIERAAEKPWVNQMDWNLSKSHPKKDGCDLRKAESPYPADAVPPRPHPQCLCYVTEREIPEDDWIDGFLNGDYDDYLEQQLNNAGIRQETPAFAPVAQTSPVPTLSPEKPLDLQPDPIKTTPSGKTPKSEQTLADLIPEVAKPVKLSEKVQNWVRQGKSREEIHKLSGLINPATTNAVVDRVLRENAVPANLMERKTADTTVTLPSPPKAAEVKVRPVTKAPPRPVPPTPSPLASAAAPGPARTTPAARGPRADEPAEDQKSETLKRAETRIVTRGMPAEMAKRVRGVFAQQERVVGSKILRVKSVSAASRKTLSGTDGITAKNGTIRLAREIVEKPGALRRGVRKSYFCGHDHDELEGTIAHEMGHALLLTEQIRSKKHQAIIERALSEAFGIEVPAQIRDRLRGEVIANPDFDQRLEFWLYENKSLVASRVSEYGTVKFSEFIAEVWTEYTMKDAPGREVQIVGDALKQIILDQKER
jgi:hypothetical protein